MRSNVTISRLAFPRRLKPAEKLCIYGSAEAEPFQNKIKLRHYPSLKHLSLPLLKQTQAPSDTPSTDGREFPRRRRLFRGGLFSAECRLGLLSSRQILLWRDRLCLLVLP